MLPCVRSAAPGCPGALGILTTREVPDSLRDRKSPAEVQGRGKDIGVETAPGSLGSLTSVHRHTSVRRWVSL